MFRSKLIWEIRKYLNGKGYTEIETPILNNKASGAMARPFVTHHNALDIDLYLRIAPETYLKRAIIGGFTKVYEFARCFRNEGMDTTHLQDFTMLEGYGAYMNYRDNMKFLREMIQEVVMNLFGKLEIKINGEVVDLSGEWESVTMRDLILRYCPIDIKEANTKEKLLEKIKTEKLDIDSEVPLESLGYGNLVDQLYKKVARCHVVKPIFLARANDFDSSLTDRFQLVINGAEIINAYSELVDPIEQEKRLIEQAELKNNGDDEAMMMDRDYINAMEYGMPPKDCVLFPLMKPEDK